jgi:hypothetical protein
MKYLVTSLKSCKEELERQTHNQVRENRRAMDRRAKRAFEDEHKGPSKFAGKRAEHLTQEELRWRVPNGLKWVEWQEEARDGVWEERLVLLHRECPRIQVHHIVEDACVGVIQVGKQAEEEVQKRITAAGERWTHQAAMQNELEFARTIGDLAAKWKIIPGDDTQREEVMATAMKELLRQSNSAQEQARIGSKGLRGSQEHQWVTNGPKARQEMEEWLHHLDADTPSISPVQLKWDQQQLVLDHSGLGWAEEVSIWGAHIRERVRGLAPVQPTHGTGRSSARGGLSGGSQGQTRIEPSAGARGTQRDGKLVRIVTLTVPTLSLVDSLLTESQKWDSESLINRQILMDEGPWRGTDMTVAWELYFQAQGLAPGAWCGQSGCWLQLHAQVQARRAGCSCMRKYRRGKLVAVACAGAGAASWLQLHAQVVPCF